MRDSFSPVVRQHETHRQLVTRTIRRGRLAALRSIDAVIVPAGRDAALLSDAISLAQESSRWLVVLCSRDCRPDEVSNLFAQRALRHGLAIEVDTDYSHPLTEFRTSAKEEFRALNVGRSTDLSLKRNLGLLLARMVGWRSVCFMDDDIYQLDPAQLGTAAWLLDHYPKVGMPALSYPDNSAVCHANRVSGGPQDVFPSGSALAVDCSQTPAFFPDIYNEDWFFFYDDVLRKKLAQFGTVRQRRYDPFTSPGRAASEEFGDVLAEGLFALLHYHKGWRDASVAYWAEFLGARERFLAEVVARLGTDLRRKDRRRALAAVEAAEQRRTQISPGHCAQFVKTWREDLDVWLKRLGRLPRVSVTEALRRLDLSSAFDYPEPERPRSWAGPWWTSSGKLRTDCNDAKPATDPAATATVEIVIPESGTGRRAVGNWRSFDRFIRRPPIPAEHR